MKRFMQSYLHILEAQGLLSLHYDKCPNLLGEKMEKTKFKVGDYIESKPIWGIWVIKEILEILDFASLHNLYKLQNINNQNEVYINHQNLITYYELVPSKAKFKVGDIVKVINNPDGVTQEGSLIGLTGKIIEYNEKDPIHKHLFGDESPWLNVKVELKDGELPINQFHFNENDLMLYEEKEISNKPKFQKGDRVRIIKDPYFKAAVGKEGIICTIPNVSNDYYIALNDDLNHIWCAESDLELAKSHIEPAEDKKKKYLDFSQALIAMKNGKTVTRYCFLHYYKIENNQVVLTLLGKRMNSGWLSERMNSGFVFSDEGILADDWYIIEE